MITRKVDLTDASPAAPAYHLVEKLAEKLKKLYVITWQESNQKNLPDNVEVFSLTGNKFIKIFELQSRLLDVLSKIDGVFCHQNPEYTIFSAPLAKLFRRKVVSWHTHKEVNWKLGLVNLLTDKILTASKESCRLRDRQKIEITGHGIDMEHFKKGENKNGNVFKIVSIGRISPAKDYERLINAIKDLDDQSIRVKIIGGPVLKKDQKYFKKIKKLVKKKKLDKQIKFLGPISHNKILPYYQNCDLFVNFSQTGSVDKAVLEAMACERLVLTSNEAFKDILSKQGLFVTGNLADKINKLKNLSQEEKEKIGRDLRGIVVKNHNLDNLADKIINSFNE